MAPIVVFCAGLVALGIALAVSLFAKELRLVSTPNERSSHLRPTPTGGGVGIVAAGTLSGLFLIAGSWSGWTIICASATMGLVGLADDRFDLPARVRFPIQVAVATLLVVVLGGVALPGVPWSYFVFSPFFVFIGVWWINLFNFMDGVDGIAASEACLICFGAAGLSVAMGGDVAGDPMWWWQLSIGTASLGFLVVNWPPAKVFMGDAGSTYLGAAMFGLSLYSVAAGWIGFAAWAILSATFVADATATLLRRVASGQRWFSAHREHFYQRLSRKWRSHGRVTALYLLVGLCWLLPLALLSEIYKGWSWAFLAIAYLPALSIVSMSSALNLNGD